MISFEVYFICIASRNVYLNPVAKEGAVIVNNSGIVGGVCGMGWTESETTVACRTINSTWK